MTFLEWKCVTDLLDDHTHLTMVLSEAALFPVVSLNNK